MEYADIGSTQMENCGMLGNAAYATDDPSFSIRHCSQKEFFDWLRRQGLKRFADEFRCKYIYSSGIERKTFIWSGHTYSWQGKSSRIMWVGVHGTDSICVVTRDIDLEMILMSSELRFHGNEDCLTHFRRTAISEIEDLADPDSYIRQRCVKGIKKPFGVVSVIPRTDEVHKESGHEVSNDEYVEELIFLHCELDDIQPPPTDDEKAIIAFKKIKRDMADAITEAIFQAKSKAEHDEEKAIKFLQEKMRSNMAFTMNETIQTAISAFQHLFQKKFKANEIKVSVIDPDYYVTVEEAKYKDTYVKELEKSDIEEHLAVINEPGSGNSSGGGLI